MTTLYRTPNVVIDKHEWHAIVRLRKGRISRLFYFRPNVLPARMWQPLIQWRGHKPTWKEFDQAFGKFKRHMLQAEQSVVENARLARRVAA